MKRFAIILVILFLLPSAANAIGAIKGQDSSGDTWGMACEKSGDGRCLQNPAQMALQINACDATTGWSAIGNDTTGLATDFDHVEGSNSLEFDKVNGAADTKIGGIVNTITSVDLTDYIESGGFLSYSLNVSATTDIDYCFIRLGTSVSHYNEWRIDDDSLAAGWSALRFNANAPATAGSTGNGITWNAVTWVSVGCAFDAETSTLADIRVDNIFATRGYNVAADINATVSSSASTVKVDLAEVAGIVTNVNGGNKDAGTQTIAVADDDIVSDAATETAAAINASSQMDVNIAASTGLALNDGAKSATTQRVVVANDDIVSDAATETAAAINASNQFDANIAAQSLTAVKVSATAAANTLGNPMFTQLSQDGTNAIAAAYPLPVSATMAANATANRIYTHGNVDQLGGAAINVNGGAIDTGTQTVTIATDDPVNDAAVETSAAINASSQMDVNIAAQAATALVVSATAAANTLANPMFVQVSADGTNAMDATHPLIVSATAAANATANRIYTHANVDQLGGAAINVNGGNRDTGTATIAIADDDNVSTKLTGIDSDTNIIQGDTTSIQTSIELRNAKLDDDAVAQCVAITASDVDYNIVTAGDWVCMTATGNTAYIRCGTTPAVDHTVGNFSIIVPEGATICERLTGPQCAVIGVTAGGFLCFGHKNSAL